MAPNVDPESRSPAADPNRRLTAAITQDPSWFGARLEVEVTSLGQSVEDPLKSLRKVLALQREDQPFPDRNDSPSIAPVNIPV